MNTQNQQTSAVIIGAGPGGCATSFFLSKYRIPHIIIDKEIFPRDKVCGDACSGKTALVINRANPGWLDEILGKPTDFLPAWGIKFVAPNGKALDIPFSPNRAPGTKAPGFTLPRLAFDNFLFGKVPSDYSTILQGAVIEEIELQEDLVNVRLSHNGNNILITSPLIIGADGDKSAVRRKFLPEDTSAKTDAVGVRGYYKGVTGMHPENFIELHFLPEVLPGYLWIFPLPNGMANVGVGILSERIRERKINLREQMLLAIKHNPDIAPRFANSVLAGKIQGWGLPLGTERSMMSGDHFMLVGDAARLVDPFSGEGIGNAMYSGMLAAAAANDAIEQQNYSSTFLKATYDDVVYKRLGEELKISTTLMHLCKYPWLFNLVVNKAAKSHELRDTISCMFSDLDVRDKLRKPTFYLKILLNK